MKFVGTTTQAASPFCGQSVSWDVQLNIALSQPLVQGQIYYMQNMTAGNFGNGYYKVNYASTSQVTSVPNLNGSNVGNGLCSNPRSLKYHKVVFAESATLSGAVEEFCDATSWNAKKNILIQEPLLVGKIYFSNASSYEGNGYFKVLTVSNNPGSDADGDYIDGPFTISDLDSDSVSDICDNCPNSSNANQSDTDGDGIGDVCDSDIDGDGILNNSDMCLYLYGNSSNFGCPGNPDLTINEELSKQNSDCYSCNGYFDEIVNRPTIYRYGGNITLNPLVIKNIGNGNVSIPYGPILIKFYLSTDQNLNLQNLNQGNGSDIGFGDRTVDISSGIIAGGNYNTGVSIEGSDIGNRVPYGNYYLVIVIDSENALGNSETNKSNNIYYLPVKYTGTLPTGKTISIKLQNTNSTNEILDEKLIELYSIEVYNFQGQEVLSKEVTTKEEENKLLQSLSSGLYVVKSKGKTYKVSIK